jgi:AAA domain
MTDPSWKEFRDQLNRQEPVEQKPEWPEPIIYQEFERQPIEKPRPLVEGILDVASRMIFGGGSKTYKTWAMSDLALSVVVGAPWWGFTAYVAAALDVNFELKPYYMQRRLRAIRAAKKIDCGELHILNLRGVEVMLEAFVEMLLKLIEKHKILIIFVDPFYKLLAGRDERVSAEINQILAAFDRINLLTGASVIFAAHFTKGNQAGKESIDRISGGGSINRDPDNLVTLTKHETEHAFTVDFTLRDFAPVAPFVVRWEHPLLVRTDLDPDRIKRPQASRLGRGGAPSSYSIENLFKLIEENDDELATEQLISLANQTLGWARRTVFNKLEILKRSKRIFFSMATNKWNIAAK